MLKKSFEISFSSYLIGKLWGFYFSLVFLNLFGCSDWIKSWLEQTMTVAMRGKTFVVIKSQRFITQKLIAEAQFRHAYNFATFNEILVYLRVTNFFFTIEFNLIKLYWGEFIISNWWALKSAMQKSKFQSSRSPGLKNLRFYILIWLVVVGFFWVSSSFSPGLFFSPGQMSLFFIFASVAFSSWIYFCKALLSFVF